MLLIAGKPQAQAESLRGKVIAITDGDTITLLDAAKLQHKIRLNGIDAPEKSQAFGAKSKDALSELVAGKEVTVDATGKDKYDRTLGTVFIGKKNVNESMVERGWAWHFKQYDKTPKLARLELEARNARLGLWADPNPLPPWEFRARQKAGTGAPAESSQYWLNTSSNVRHNESCEHFRQTKAGRLCGPNDGKACGKCGG